LSGQRSIGVRHRSGAFDLATELLGLASASSVGGVDHVADATSDRALGLVKRAAGFALGLTSRLLRRALSFESSSPVSLPAAS